MSDSSYRKFCHEGRVVRVTNSEGMAYVQLVGEGADAGYRFTHTLDSLPIQDEQWWLDRIGKSVRIEEVVQELSGPDYRATAFEGRVTDVHAQVDELPYVRILGHDTRRNTNLVSGAFDIGNENERRWWLERVGKRIRAEIIVTELEAPESELSFEARRDIIKKASAKLYEAEKQELARFLEEQACPSCGAASALRDSGSCCYTAPGVYKAVCSACGTRSAYGHTSIPHWAIEGGEAKEVSGRHVAWQKLHG